LWMLHLTRLSVKVLTECTGRASVPRMTDGIDLKVERVRAGILQQDVAASLGVTRQTVKNWERSIQLPAHKATAYRDAVSRLSKTSGAA
jgi:DNA-binding transcriptional regulator YiaG